MSHAISRDLLGKVIDDVFDGAIEDASVIEQIYASIKKHEAIPTPEAYITDALTNGGILYGEGVGRPIGVASSSPAPQTHVQGAKARLSELLDEYFDLGFDEGVEGRLYDTPNGAAQKVRSEIDAIIAALATAPEVSDA